MPVATARLTELALELVQVQVLEGTLAGLTAVTRALRRMAVRQWRQPWPRWSWQAPCRMAAWSR